MLRGRPGSHVRLIGRTADLLKRMEEKRQLRVGFDTRTSGEKTRYERLLAAISTKRTILRKSRDLIALRLNMI